MFPALPSPFCTAYATAALVSSSSADWTKLADVTRHQTTRLAGGSVR
jgi:hypothetical protein